MPHPPEREGGYQPVPGPPLGKPPGGDVPLWVKEAQARKEAVMVECSACSHAWACAYLPMPLDQAAQLMIAARCPKGCKAPIHLANLPGV